MTRAVVESTKGDWASDRLVVAYDDPSGIVSAYEFQILWGTARPGVMVLERWRDLDEGYGDYEAVTVPFEIWEQAAPWIQEQLVKAK